MIINKSSFSLSFPTFDDDIFFKVSEMKHEEYRKAFKALSEKHLVRSERACTLAQVRDAIGTSEGVVLQYSIDSFLEKLTVKVNGADFELSIGLFPKKKTQNKISMTVKNPSLHHSLSENLTPESIVAFVRGIAQWIPEYLSIEEKVEAAEKRKRMACDIAYDLFQRSLEPVMEEKGYHDYRFSRHSDKAHIAVKSGNGTSFRIDVNLLEDFHDTVLKIAQSLPQL